MRERIALGILVVGAAGLRLWGVGQGLPHLDTRPDEMEVLLRTRGFPSGALNPHWFVYPPFFFHLVWIWDEAVLASLRMVGTPAPPPYLTLLRTDPALPLLLGRLLSVAVGTATVPLAWNLARRLAGPAGGLAAAAFVATNFLHARDSQVLKGDVHANFGIALVFGARFIDQPTVRRVLALGSAIGFATALKYNAGFLLLPTLVLAITRGHAPVRLGCALVCATAFIFFALCPHLILDARQMLEWSVAGTRNMYITRPEWRLAADAGWLESLVTFVRSRAFAYHLTVSLPCGSGGLATGAAIVAIGWVLVRDRRPILMLISGFTVLYYLVAGASPVHLARYMTAIVPGVAVLIGAMLGRFLGHRPIASAVVVAALAVEPLLATIAYDRIVSRPDTRVLAAAWLAEHAPATAEVAFVGSGLFRSTEPTLPPHVHRVAPAGLASSPVKGPAYVPFAALTDVIRPGPIVRIYRYRPS